MFRKIIISDYNDISIQSKSIFWDTSRYFKSIKIQYFSDPLSKTNLFHIQTFVDKVHGMKVVGNR